jgi:PTS system nitrogen regulatory IIA component
MAANSRLQGDGFDNDGTQSIQVYIVLILLSIPNGKMNGVSRPIISFGRSKQGLDFDSMDGQPAHLFFLLIAPEDSSSVHLQVLAKIAKILKNRDFRKKLMEPGTKKELYQTIVQTDEEY